MVTAPKFTRELYKLLENLEVREKSEAMAQDAANEALIALERLPFAPDRLAAFERLAGFVVARGA